MNFEQIKYVLNALNVIIYHPKHSFALHLVFLKINGQ